MRADSAATLPANSMISIASSGFLTMSVKILAPRRCEARVSGPQARPMRATSPRAALAFLPASMMTGQRPSFGPGIFRPASASVLSTSGCSMTVGGLSSNHLALMPIDMASIARSNTIGIPSALYRSAAFTTALANRSGFCSVFVAVSPIRKAPCTPT